jgi:hypothetical protein
LELLQMRFEIVELLQGALGGIGIIPKFRLGGGLF